MNVPAISQPFWKRLAKRYLGGLLEPLLSKEPAACLIRQTARQQWRLLALNLMSSLVDALCEGATLAVLYQAVKVLSSPATGLTRPSGALVGWLRPLTSWLSGLPPSALFFGLLAIAVGLQALQSLSRFLNQVSVGYFIARCRANVTTLIHRQVLRFSFPCASAYKVGDLVDYAIQGSETIRQQIDFTSRLLVGLLMVITYLVVLISISPWLLLAALVMGGCIAWLQNKLLPRIRGGSQSVVTSQVEISRRITEDFQGLRLLHSCGQLDWAGKRLGHQMAELERQLRGQARRLSVVGPFSSFLPILAISLFTGVSFTVLRDKGSGVLPSLVTFVLALQRLNSRMGSFADNFSGLANNAGRIDRLYYILSPQGKEFRSMGGKPFAALRQAIRFENVSLQYAPELPPAIRQISFHLPKGQMIALVGPSGAGKSSVADLLVGLYAPSSGTIWVDDTPLGLLDLATWQQHLGVVSQDTFLFNASLADNIAFGMPGATQGQIREAAQAAQADGFIQALPAGYDTVVGERGYRLSGGQRQRISLARAILRQPELLILDEATSALDTQSERLVQEAIERFEREHTVLVIAHRLSTIVKADQILVLDHGRVVEHGTHASLLAAGGLYSQLWHQQSKASQPAHA